MENQNYQHNKKKKRKYQRKENPLVVQPGLSVAIIGTVVAMKYFQRRSL